MGAVVQLFSAPVQPEPQKQHQEARVADLDNGYTRIANELMEELPRTPMTKNQMRVVQVVIRKTYGFCKKLDWISNEQLAAACRNERLGIKFSANLASTVKNELVQANVLIQKGRQVGINSNLDQWFADHQPKVTENQKGLRKTSKETLQETSKPDTRKPVTTKETTPKEKKEKITCRADAQRKKAEFADQAKQVIEHLNSVCGRHYPTAANCNTIKGVVARLKSGCTAEQLKLVIDHKASEWLGDAKMGRFLQPSTLFKVSKIEENIADAQAWLASGKAVLGQTTADEGGVPAPNASGKVVGEWLLRGGKFDRLALGTQENIKRAHQEGKLDGTKLQAMLMAQGVLV